ncbi:hypothetical protein FHS49_001655 [Sphingobium boeckii]|uniref:Uncharacterized protein n=2 Tax=Sphingobium boeckii TaxID=1082345 RepID=A0A7W9AHK7_9SPHN|nr:hypothetical protein [Sphingobium boeckii]
MNTREKFGITGAIIAVAILCTTIGLYGRSLLSPAETIANPPGMPDFCRVSVNDPRCSAAVQWKSADAAREAANWAWWQLWISAAGVVGLGITLWFNFRALRLAEHESNETKDALQIARENAAGAARAAQAASEGNQIAREAMQKQLRPYVYLEDLHVSITHLLSYDALADCGTVEIVIKNYGQSPAKDVSMVAQVILGGYWSDRPGVDLQSAARINFADIPSGAVRRQGGYSALDIKRAHQQLTDATASIFVEGQIRYTDAFGNTYWTNFQRALTGEDYHTGPSAITPHWNQAK